MARRARPLALVTFAAAWATATLATVGPPVGEPPAASGARAPRLAAGRPGEALLVWFEPSADAPKSWAVRFARLGAEGWGPARTIVAGAEVLAHGADPASIARAGDGALVATWSERSGAGEASAIEVARSADDGETWKRLGRLHADATPTEHGFVSLVPEADGVRAFWLDGRETVAGGATALRSAVVGARVGPEELLDPRVCDCCMTAAGLGMNGPIVVYRDRAADEVRESAVVRRVAGGWSAPAAVGGGAWRVAACPVNGPALAARAAFVAVASYRAADDEPRVEVALSHDAGKSFGPAIGLDAEHPLGRLAAAIGADGAARALWVAKRGAEARLRLARVAPDGRLDEPIDLGAAAAGRVAGSPQLVATGDRLLAAWIDASPAGRLVVAEVSVPPRR